MWLTLLDARLRRERPGDRYASAVTDFRRSSFCGSAACVEVHHAVDKVLVRDSKDADSPVLRFTVAEWTAFTAGIRAGEFDAPA